MSAEASLTVCTDAAPAPSGACNRTSAAASGTKLNCMSADRQRSTIGTTARDVATIAAGSIGQFLQPSFKTDSKSPNGDGRSSCVPFAPS